MIKYALICDDCEYEFEAWFSNSSAFEKQVKKRQVSCPACDGHKIAKQIMAPSVTSTKAQTPMAMSPEAAFKAFASKARKHIAESFDYVGSDFAKEARAIHKGEADERPIWGKATQAESKALADEGVPSETLPEAFTPPVPKTQKDLN